MPCRLAASPQLIDLVAVDVPELLRKLDGRPVTRFDGTAVVLRTAGARVVPIEMNWRQRLLSAVAHPNVAFILLSLGTLGLTIELWSPGAVLPGVAGGLCLLLAIGGICPDPAPRSSIRCDDVTPPLRPRLERWSKLPQRPLRRTMPQH